MHVIQSHTRIHITSRDQEKPSDKPTSHTEQSHTCMRVLIRTQLSMPVFCCRACFLSFCFSFRLSLSLSLCPSVSPSLCFLFIHTPLHYLLRACFLFLQLAMHWHSPHETPDRITTTMVCSVAHLQVRLSRCTPIRAHAHASTTYPQHTKAVGTTANKQPKNNTAPTTNTHFFLIQATHTQGFDCRDPIARTSSHRRRCCTTSGMYTRLHTCLCFTRVIQIHTHQPHTKRLKYHEKKKEKKREKDWGCGKTKVAKQKKKCSKHPLRELIRKNTPHG